jgi:poly-gamma-glutamate system protein
LKAAILSSLGASMYGAADTGFTWLDMESAVRAARIWRSASHAALLGGESGMARDLGAGPRSELEAAARRAGVPLIGGSTLADAVKGSAAALGLDAAVDAGPKLLINVGGAQVALGDCKESADIPPGLIAKPLTCNGTPGLVHLALSRGIPVLNLHKVKALAQRYGLPYDPVPLPFPGRNAFVYGN